MNEEFPAKSVILEFACGCIIVREILDNYLQLSLYYCFNHTLIKKMMYKEEAKDGNRL